MVRLNKLRNLRGRRGYLIIMALAILFILLMLALALISQGQSAVVYTLRARTVNLEEQAVNKAKVEFYRTVQPPIPGSRESGKMPPELPLEGSFKIIPESVTGEKDFYIHGTYRDRESVYNNPYIYKDYSTGRQLKKFDPLEAPRIGYFGTQMKEGFAGVEVPPWCTFLALHSPLNRTYMLVYSSNFPFGIYAPGGDIVADRTTAFSNPTIKYVWGDLWNHGKIKFEEAKMYTGGPVHLMADGEISIKNFPHGRAFSKNGPIVIKGGAIGFHRDDIPDFTSMLRDQIHDAKSRLVNSAGGVDKTDLVIGSPLDLAKLIDGKSPDIKGIAALQQADSFPFIIIPGWRVREYLLWTEVKFWFNVPTPKDGSKPLSPSQKRQRESQLQLARQIYSYWSGFGIKNDRLPQDLTNGQMDTIYSRQQNLKGDLNNTYVPDDKSTIDSLVKGIDTTWQDYNPTDNQKDRKYPSVSAIQTTFDNQTGFAEKLNNRWKGHSINPGPNDKGPQTWKAEQTYDNKGHNYGMLMKNIGSLLWNLFKGDIKNVIRGMMHPTRVIHFKGGPPDIKWIGSSEKPNGFNWECDLTVPQGRTLKFDCNVTIRGDLWIMDGACLHVTKDLVVKDPSGGAGKFLTPRGRVFLGRGSSIVVGGNFSCQGNKWLGSMVIDSEIGNVQFISSAIFCDGDVSIPHGIFPGMSINNMLGQLSDKHSVKKIFSEMMNIAPVAAKAAGPFHYRKPFFASYQDSFRMEIPNEFPVPITFPTFEHDANINNKIFKYVSIVYQCILNGILGENLFTDSSWWFIGKGVVPVIPKVGFVGGVIDQLKSLSLSELSISAKDLLNELKNKVLKGLSPGHVLSIMGGLIKDIAKEIVMSMIKSAIPIPLPWGKIEEMIFGKVCRQGVLDDLRRRVEDIFSSGSNVIEQMKEEAWDKILNHLETDYTYKFYETPGVFIHANNIYIGQENGVEDQQCMFASGFFIAENNFISYANQTAGCIVSLKGNVTTREFCYYPYFTRAVVNVPKKLNLFDNIFTILTPQSDNDPVEIGVILYHVLAEGWR